MGQPQKVAKSAARVLIMRRLAAICQKWPPRKEISMLNGKVDWT